VGSLCPPGDRASRRRVPHLRPRRRPAGRPPGIGGRPARPHLGGGQHPPGPRRSPQPVPRLLGAGRPAGAVQPDPGRPVDRARPADHRRLGGGEPGCPSPGPGQA